MSEQAVSEQAVSEQAWITALDALESLLDRQRDFIAGTGPMPDDPWESPASELPASVRTRALVLAGTCDKVEGELRTLLNRCANPLMSPYR